MGKCKHPINRRQIWWQIQRDGGNQFEVNRCYACGEWLPLGKATDTPETAVEQCAAWVANVPGFASVAHRDHHDTEECDENYNYTFRADCDGCQALYLASVIRGAE